MKKTNYYYNKEGKLTCKANNKGRYKYITYGDNGNIQKMVKLYPLIRNTCPYSNDYYEYDKHGNITYHKDGYDGGETYTKNIYNDDGTISIKIETHVYLNSDFVKQTNKMFYTKDTLMREEYYECEISYDYCYDEDDLEDNFGQLCEMREHKYEYDKNDNAFYHTITYHNYIDSNDDRKVIIKDEYYEDSDIIKKEEYQSFDSEGILETCKITENDVNGKPIKQYNDNIILFKRVDELVEEGIISYFINEANYVYKIEVYELDNNGNKRKIYREFKNDDGIITSSTVYKYNKKGLLSSKTKKKHAQKYNKSK